MVALWCQSLSPDQDSGGYASAQLLAGWDTSQLFCMPAVLETRVWANQRTRISIAAAMTDQGRYTPYCISLTRRRVTTLVSYMFQGSVISLPNLRHFACAPAFPSENANISEMDNWYGRRNSRPTISCGEAPTGRQDRG